MSVARFLAAADATATPTTTNTTTATITTTTFITTANTDTTIAIICYRDSSGQDIGVVLGVSRLRREPEHLVHARRRRHHRVVRRKLGQGRVRLSIPRRGAQSSADPSPTRRRRRLPDISPASERGDPQSL